MVTKTYKCPVHGEFDHDCSVNDGELKTCPKKTKCEMPNHSIEYKACNMPVIRVYKKLTYMDAEGFCGKVYGCP